MIVIVPCYCLDSKFPAWVPKRNSHSYCSQLLYLWPVVGRIKLWCVRLTCETVAHRLTLWGNTIIESYVFPFSHWVFHELQVHFPLPICWDGCESSGSPLQPPVTCTVCRNHRVILGGVRAAKGNMETLHLRIWVACMPHIYAPQHTVQRDHRAGAVGRVPPT